MWVCVTGISGKQSYINMDKVYEMYTREDGTTVLEFGNGNEVHIEENPWEVLTKRRVEHV